MKPKPKQPDKFPVANSMTQVTAWIGMPKALIVALKASGCQAFDSANRVKTGVLLRYFFTVYYADGNLEQPPDGIATWREAWNRVETKRAEIKLEKDKGDVIGIADAEAQAAEAEGFYFAELDRMLRELPTALTGLSAAQVHAVLLRTITDLRQRSREKFAVKPETTKQ